MIDILERLNGKEDHFIHKLIDSSWSIKYGQAPTHYVAKI